MGSQHPFGCATVHWRRHRHGLSFIQCRRGMSPPAVEERQ
ncbi:hypothetical protein SS05631_c22320 [Sinorhizobium sp. CCBAU 05631]|nr:hypothetical protein SS05631_c22320 [Sinorhizobium sp. CCBAU 05631]